MIRGLYSYDEYNTENRTVKTTKTREYNCGGYALGLFNWFLPWATEDEGKYCQGNLLDWLFDLQTFDHEKVEKQLVHTVAYMIGFFKGRLREINSIEELKSDEYAIAYKMGNDDFHFAKRMSNGVWYHKMGGTPIRRIPKEIVFAEEWDGGRYYSRTVLFAMKKS